MSPSQCKQATPRDLIRTARIHCWISVCTDTATTRYISIREMRCGPIWRWAGPVTATMNAVIDIPSIFISLYREWVLLCYRGHGKASSSFSRVGTNDWWWKHVSAVERWQSIEVVIPFQSLLAFENTVSNTVVVLNEWNFRLTLPLIVKILFSQRFYLPLWLSIRFSPVPLWQLRREPFSKRNYSGCHSCILSNISNSGCGCPFLEFAGFDRLRLGLWLYLFNV